MRLVLITGAYPDMPDGIGDYTGCLARALDRAGHTVAVVTTCDERVRTDRDAGVEVLPIVRKWNLRGVWSLLRFCRQWRPDVVDLQFPSSRFVRTLALTFTPLLSRLLRRTPCFVTTLHEFGIYGAVNRARQLAYAVGSHRVIVTNERDMELIGRLVPFCRRKLHLVRIGSNIPRSAATAMEREHCRRTLGLQAGDPLICHFGFVHPNKGVDLLVEALGRLVRERPRLRLLLIGILDPEHDGYHARLSAMVRDMRLDEHVLQAGFCGPGEVSDLLQAADLAVMPFRDGASCRRGSLLAALDHGLPVVTTQPASGALAVLDGDQRLTLVPREDVEALVDGIRRGLGAGSAGSAREEQRPQGLPSEFQWDYIARQVVSLTGGDRPAALASEEGDRQWA